MDPITFGKRIPFGITQILPLAGFPKGKTKVRIRSDDFARIYIKHGDTLTGYIPYELNGVWIPCVSFGENHHIHI